MKRNDIVIRSGIFAAVAILSLLALSSYFQRPVYQPYSGVSYPDIRVSLFWERDMVAVRVDNREERVPKSQLESSPIYQEAINRIPRDNRPRMTEVHWRYVRRIWIPLLVFTWVFLFRVWQPMRPYVDGTKV